MNRATQRSKLKYKINFGVKNYCNNLKKRKSNNKWAFKIQRFRILNWDKISVKAHLKNINFRIITQQNNSKNKLWIKEIKIRICSTNGYHSLHNNLYSQLKRVTKIKLIKFKGLEKIIWKRRWIFNKPIWQVNFIDSNVLIKIMMNKPYWMIFLEI